MSRTYLGSTSDDAYDATHEPPRDPASRSRIGARRELIVASIRWAAWRQGQCDADELGFEERALLAAVARYLTPEEP